MLTQQALRHGPQRLSRLILETLQEAGTEAARQMTGIVQKTMGGTFSVDGLLTGELPEISPGDPDEYLRSKGIRW
ncbi:hypothetical protein ACFQ07_32230 [Actinomadura adrarensis]|uniref:Uncharacterized protein n=1 Tax=Actinomadura adrarensis TaxID=1819600 RepID=A0ABW3CR90_9ACTN